MAEAVFQRRSLSATEIADLRCIEALRWGTPLGSGLRLYFGCGTRPDALGCDPAGEVRLTQLISVGGGLAATGSAPFGDGPVDLPLVGGTITLATTEPESDLFDDLNVILGQRHDQSAGQIAEWLAFHVRDHDVQAGLLLNRAAPSPASEAFSEELLRETSKINGLRRLVLVDAALPLGSPDQPRVGHPATAPRPKSRASTPDDWLSPLAEPVLYDALKWRFLTRAGAVLALEPCDLLDALEDGINLFEACRQSHTGLIPVTGEMIFPWRMKKGRAPAPGDHICRADPKIAAPSRWCVAPKRIDLDICWTPEQIVGLSAVADETASYTRAASMLFAKSQVAELVDKALLVASPGLLDRAERRFGHDPVRPPEPANATAKAPQPPPSGRTVIVTCMKNEGPFILEWLAYHRMIGVDDFLIYTNDCDDGTDTLLDLLQERGLVQRRDNPFGTSGAKPQQAALEAAQSEPVVQNAGWIISMDVDEFLNIHAGEGMLADLFAAIPGASAVSITWRLFGNSDQGAFEDRFVTEQFTRCAPQLIRRPHQAWGFKTLYQNNGLFQSIGVHRPKGFQGKSALWVNGSGQPMPPSIFRTGWRSGIDSYGYDLATLNHYAVRSVESFLVKRDRGRVNHVARDQGLAYWFRMNNNDQEDRSIQRHLPGLCAAVDAMKADPGIAKAHAHCVAAHQARIAALLQLPDFSDLHAQLSSDRMQRLSRMHRHFGMNVFLRGPSSIPDRVLDPGMQPNFFFNAAPPEGKTAE